MYRAILLNIIIIIHYYSTLTLHNGVCKIYRDISGENMVYIVITTTLMVNRRDAVTYDYINDDGCTIYRIPTRRFLMRLS